jgi:hypothetical protein
VLLLKPCCGRVSTGLLYRQSVLVKLSSRMEFLADLDELLSACAKNASFANDPIFALGNRRRMLALAFVIASSHCLRDNIVPCPVFAPFLHMLGHSFDPNCEIREENGNFVVYARKYIYPNMMLEVAPPPVSFDERVYDFGFRPHPEYSCSETEIFVEVNGLNAARAAVGLTALAEFKNSKYCTIEDESVGPASIDSEPILGFTNRAWVSAVPSDSIMRFTESLSSGKDCASVDIRSCQYIDEATAADWQVLWLQSLRLFGPDKVDWEKLGFYGDMGGNSVKEGKFLPSRLWAALRVLYSANEHDLTRHGFDPTLLQQPESVLPPKQESNVLKTIMGVLALNFGKLGGNFMEEIEALKSNNISVFESRPRRLGVAQFSEREVRDARNCLTQIATYFVNCRTYNDETTLKKFDVTRSELHELLHLDDKHVSSALSVDVQAALFYRIQKKRALVKMIFVLLGLLEVSPRTRSKRCKTLFAL